MQERSLPRFLNDLPILPKLLLIPAIPFASLVLFSIMTYLNVQTFSQDEERLNKIYLVQKTAAQYMRSVADLETTFLGYVISEYDPYLKRFEVGKAAVLAAEKELKSQLPPEQEPRLREIQDLNARFFAEKEDVIKGIQLGKRSEAIQYVREGRSRQIMVEVRKWMASFENIEEQVAQQELSRLSYDRTWAQFFILGGGLVTLVLVIFALALIAHSIATPLAALSKVVGTTADEVVPAIPVFERKDEIGELTRVMKKMSVQIRKVLDEVQQSEAKYRGLVDHAPLGIFMTKGVQVTFSNRYNQQLAGLDPEEDLDPGTFVEQVHPEDRDRVLKTLSQAVEERRPYEMIFRFLHADGDVRTILSRNVPILALESTQVVYIGFNVDITTLDNLQSRLRRTEKLAMLGQVAAGIAHELRNPLVGIGSTAKVLIDELDSGDPKREEIEVILSETRRLDRIVNQIVDYARPRRIMPTRIDLAVVIGEVSKLLRSHLENKHLSIQVMLSSTSDELYADRDQLTQVLLNVVHNAIDAVPAGGPPIEIMVHDLFRDERPGTAIQVKDAGPGIQPDLLPQVFQPFVTSGKRQGMGLGLAICKNIVESHEGDIHVTSGPEKGTVVSIWLPHGQETGLERG